MGLLASFGPLQELMMGLSERVYQVQTFVTILRFTKKQEDLMRVVVSCGMRNTYRYHGGNLNINVNIPRGVQEVLESAFNSFSVRNLWKPAATCSQRTACTPSGLHPFSALLYFAISLSSLCCLVPSKLVIGILFEEIFSSLLMCLLQIHLNCSPQQWCSWGGLHFSRALFKMPTT